MIKSLRSMGNIISVEQHIYHCPEQAPPPPSLPFAMVFQVPMGTYSEQYNISTKSTNEQCSQLYCIDFDRSTHSNDHVSLLVVVEVGHKRGKISKGDIVVREVQVALHVIDVVPLRVLQDH